MFVQIVSQRDKNYIIKSKIRVDIVPTFEC